MRETIIFLLVVVLMISGLVGVALVARGVALSRNGSWTLGLFEFICTGCMVAIYAAVGVAVVLLP